jgi:hypothetical protein
MRPLRVVAVLSALLVAMPSFAQQWTTYTNTVDRFEVNLPGQPKVEEITWGLFGFISSEGGVEKIFG